MKGKLARTGGWIGALSLLAVGMAPAAWNDPVTNTPSIIQLDFGPYGSHLPGDGENYCEPTSAVMSLFWLGSNGFTQITPSTYPGQNDPYTYNLERLMGGLMQTSSSQGTYDSAAIQGISDYLSAAGLSGAFSDVYNGGDSVANLLNPSWMASQLASNAGANPGSITFINFSIAWYGQSSSSSTIFTPEGGHELALLAVIDPTGDAQLILNNAYPSALENVPNVPESNPQTLGITQVPAGWDLPGMGLASEDYWQLQSSDGTVGDDSTTKAIVRSAYAFSVDTSANPTLNPSWTPADWVISGSKTINTNGATFTVQAAVTGAGGIFKTGEGAMVLASGDDLTGSNAVSGGALGSTYAGDATPLGTGSFVLTNGGTIGLTPAGSGGPLSFAIASGSGSSVTFGNGGGALEVGAGAYSSLSVTLGDAVATSGNLIRQDAGTFVIIPSSGISALGSTEQVFIAGGVASHPANTHGMVAPYIVGQDNDENASGYFLAYDESAGFKEAAAVSSLNTAINAATSATVYAADTDQTVATNGLASVYALQVNGSEVSGTNAVLQVGSQQAGESAGVILNGGSITTSALSFGAAEGVIYASEAGGLISSTITSSAGLTTFGPGTATLTGDNSSTLSGQVTVNSGTLVAQSASGSATGSANVAVQANATFQVNSGSVTGNVSVLNSGTLVLAGGTISGDVTVAEVGQSSANPGGTLLGSGTIEGSTTARGVIASGASGGNITFAGSANLNYSQFFWQLDSLTSDSSEAGLEWNMLTFLGDSTVGTSDSDAATVYIQFGAGVATPDTVDAFWLTGHEWKIWDFSQATSYDWYESGDGNTAFTYGNFDVYEREDDTSVYLRFTPVPEPSAIWLALAGCGAMLAARRFRQRR